MNLTKEQHERLAELKKELEVWKRHQKLNKFKELPAHIRQEIVDEAIINDMVSNINNIKESDFPNQQELLQLINCKSSNNIFATVDGTSLGLSYNYHLGSSHSNISRYTSIIQCFTKDELIKAHLDASIDDEISN